MLQKIEIAGVLISQNENGLYSLNDLHKASGGDAKDKPSEWLRNQKTQDLLDIISIAGNPAIETKQKIGTFANREIVIAYASWLSPDFYLHVISTYLSTIDAMKEERESLLNMASAVSKRIEKDLKEPTQFEQKLIEEAKKDSRFVGERIGSRFFY
jgi:KilA-N domain